MTAGSTSPPWHALQPDAAHAAINMRAGGLSEAEAARRLIDAGPNEMATARTRSLVRIVMETLREPMFLLLIGAAGLYLALGDVGEGLFLLAGAGCAIGLVIVQEARSERALAMLRQLAQPRARVIRDGVEHTIEARQLVPGDIVLIGEGERVPADGLLVGGDVLSVDESALTGESAPVAKQPTQIAAQAIAAPIEEMGSQLMAATLLVRGQGVFMVTKTGAHSALGRIGASLAEIGREPTPLQKTAGRLVAMLGVVALGFCALVVIAYGLVRGDWIEGLLAGITVAISLIPEEFPMVLAVFLAIGAWRLATHQVLVRRSAVIETLGGATVLCVDKTGTLTENRMQVARLWTPQGEFAAVDGAGASELVRAAALASALRPVDPMDRALRALAQAQNNLPSESGASLQTAWPLRRDLLAVIQLWRGQDGGQFAAAKGAPEAVFSLCRLTAQDIEPLQSVIDDYARQGLRVLGVAQARGGDLIGEDPRAWPFALVGLIGFIDPLRADAASALAEARGAGVKVIMVTGDHPATALAIARAAGIDTEAGVLTGAEFAALPLPTLRARLRDVRVFARIAPEQKLAIIQALKANGEVVAMTGDGVNDAPALEAAHIGVSMGQKGTDVAREASDLVLLDDNFASIVGGVRLGRRIFANLRRALTFITAVHVPIAGLALAPVLMGLRPLLMPMHVVLLELVIDPMCALVFEGEPSDKDAMRRPPRKADEALFGVNHIIAALAQGLAILFAVLALYLWASIEGMSAAQARATAFTALIVAVLALALGDSISSAGLFARHRRIYWAIAAAVAAVVTLILSVPALASIFDMTTPAPGALLLAVAVGAASAAVARLTLLRRSGRPNRAAPS